MKLKKKTAMVLSFAVGILLFGTTALAEIVSKSGYEQMKDALKATSNSLSTSVSSYTDELSAVLKDNGTVIYSKEAVEKQDIANGVSESTTTIVRGTDKASDYYYRDKTVAIKYHDWQDIYFVNENPDPIDNSASGDPFEDEYAKDIERIIDALLGNLKEYVIVSENADGSREFSGSLSEAQIPALVNSITSIAVRSKCVDLNTAYGDIIPQITQDIFVKEVRGRMLVDKDGVIQSVLGTGILLGKDQAGKEHNMSFEVLGKVTNINSTKITKPDLTGKKVEKEMGSAREGISNHKMYIGTYKNNIAIQKDGKFVKIGERIININQADDKTVSGSYKEVYLNGYGEYAGDTKDFTFTGNIIKEDYGASYKVVVNPSARGSVVFYIEQAKISFYLEAMTNNKVPYDGEFSRVFE